MRCQDLCCPGTAVSLDTRCKAFGMRFLSNNLSGNVPLVEAADDIVFTDSFKALTVG